MLKKLLCLTLIFAAVLSLAACSAKYEPVPSTEEEARVVMRFALDGKKYELKYELYRALFLTYKEALSHRLGFIREFFTFDLNVRNQKVRYLNQALGRAPEKDILSLRDPEAEETGLEPEEPEFKESAKLQAILEGHDILARERGIDDLYWDKIDEITLFDYLNFDKILGMIVKMMIIRRWLILDEEAGRQMFKKLVDEVRGTFKGVEYNE